MIAAIAAVLADAVDLGGRAPFEVQLNVAERLLRRDVSLAGNRFEIAVFDFPRRGLGGGGATPRHGPLRKILAVEQNDSVGWRIAWAGRSFDDSWMRTLGVVDPIRKAGEHRRVVVAEGVGVGVGLFVGRLFP